MPKVQTAIFSCLGARAAFDLCLIIKSTALAGPLLVGKSAIARPRIAQAAINVVAGSLALGLGLWFFGRDGKMASYAALLVVAATSQWIGGRGWR
jgi:hypothetical protein